MGCSQRSKVVRIRPTGHCSIRRAMLSTGAGGVEQWKTLTVQLTHAMIKSRRYDEARMWCMIRRLRYPSDVEPLQMHAFCLEEMFSYVMHKGDAKVRLPSST